MACGKGTTVKAKATKGLEHRLLWTWDHSMDWAPLAEGLQEMGASNPYYRKAEDFVEDYKRAIDFYSPLGYTGMVVYGLFRDNHGGVEAAQEVCRYARKKGMYIIAGIGVNAYGGIYWEGDHEFNLSHWLDEHPELAAVGTSLNPYGRMACPSRPENLAWHRRAIQWLCETVDIGGINFETGDYGLCKCDDCKKQYGTYHWSLGHMTDFFPPLIEEARKVKSDILPICECYFDGILNTEQYRPLAALPEGTILQFCITREYLARWLKEMTAEKAAALPPHKKVIRTHIGCQWDKGERHALVAKEWSQIAARAGELGMAGTNIFGEVGNRRTVHEINYLSMAAFNENPFLKWKDFVSDELGPLFGGEARAQKYVQIVGKTRATPADLKFARAAMAKATGDEFRRWLWLCDLICRRLEHQEK